MVETDRDPQEFADEELVEPALEIEDEAEVDEFDEAEAEDDDEEEDALLEDDEEDGSSSLDELLAQRAAARRGTDDSDEDDIMSLTAETDDQVGEEPLVTRVIPMRQRQEFVCNRCRLVKSKSQLADPQRGLCRDCV